MTRAIPGRTAVAIAAAMLGTAPAKAQEANFYAGKTITFVVGFTAGGGYDIYARTLARHFGNHVPGKPTVIVQNMPGAGSLTAVRYLDTTAQKDGTVVTAFNPGVITDSLTNPEKIKLKLDQFGWLGSITRDIRICYAWNGAPVKSWDDLAKGTEFIMGATGLNTSNYVNGAVLRNLFGLKIKQITGFPGSNEMRLAIERGELHGDCGSWSSITPDWIKNNRITPLLSFTTRTLPGMPPKLPYIGTLAKTDEQRQILSIILAAGELGRPYIVNRQVSADRLVILRKAFDATVKDQAFLDEAKRQDLPVDPVDAKEAETILKAVYAAPAELVAKAKKVMQ